MPATAVVRHAAATASNTSRCNFSRTCTCAAPIATAAAIAPRCSRSRLSRGGSPPKSIADVLDLTVSEALTFFAGDTEVGLRLAPLADVGLDYLRLGQPVPTLSGGEAQRLKLAGHLAENAARLNAVNKIAEKGRAARPTRQRQGSLFLFDEPTTGLHFDDVAKLLRAFRRLIDAGHSLLVIEHNLDVVRAADWIIDLGPEGGDAGGSVVCVGTPADVMRMAASHTGRALSMPRIHCRSAPRGTAGPRCGERRAGSRGVRACRLRSIFTAPANTISRTST